MSYIIPVDVHAYYLSLLYWEMQLLFQNFPFPFTCEVVLLTSLIKP